ncbi:HEAT repeat domain-containing protein [uncultured Treponema sp.]|uniref:HEAT repeat domain-containing protein n=1 Tax=uncultured Treponema sp. TaxID=162155 RepID=UPI0025EED718|nr:HEAT repeat domain-containing protein [uncultured Treponema sp.]
MKRLSFLIFGIFLSFNLFAQEEADVSSELDSVSVDTESPSESVHAVSADFDAVSGADISDDEEEAEPEKKTSSLAGVSDVPNSKRPKSPDPEQVAELDKTDPEANEKNADILKFGLEEDISELLDTMTKNKDVRFMNQVYDLFQDTKSVLIREKILNFFKTVEDPCLEDYAVMILNDPYDEKNSTVNACFSYIQMAKTKEAVPAVVSLLESDKEEYFTGALDTLGKIGGAREAVYITEYLERDDLTVPQRQSLVRVLGQLHAVETYDKLVEYAQNEDENAFVRMYSAEAIGVMEKPEAEEILVDLFESDNPNIRQYVIKGISHFKNKEADEVLIQGLKDSHYKVRMEAISAIKENDVKDADEYLIYRIKNDPVQAVKDDSISALAKLDTSKGNEYLLSQITEKKVPDAQKARVAKVLLAEDRGIDEIVALALETAKDDRRKQLRYALGKEMAKYENASFAQVALEFLKSKDTSTAGTGLDIWAKGRYSICDAAVNELADKADLNAKNKNQLAIKAARLLGRDLDKQTEEKDKEREAKEAEKKAKKEAKSPPKKAEPDAGDGFGDAK